MVAKGRSAGPRIAGAVLAVVLCAPLMGSATAAASRSAVPGRLFGPALDASGTVVRRTPDATVERITVQDGGRSVDLYRVRVTGDFPPRALRYVVRAGNRTIGYGVPNAGHGAVETVTADPAVLVEDLSATYPETPLPETPQPGTPREPTGAVVDGPTIPNPARLGPYEVGKVQYDLGDEAWQPEGVNYRVEIAGSVRYPKLLDGGPYPLVVFMHGNHSSCFKKDRVRSEWPCRDGWRTMPSFRGYNYIAEPLASHGYIVVSIGVNGVNVKGSRHRDTGMRQRGELVDEHLRLWQRWSTLGAKRFDGRFVDAVDMGRIGTMGHSRGGEGVVWHKIVDDQRAEPFGVDAVLSLAPVDFRRRTINEVPYATVLPTCDGDVSDLQGVHFYDDSRYNLPGDPGPKHTVTLFGPNHNYFNVVWSPSSRYPGARDDGDTSACFGKRMGENKQRRLGASYVVGFFRRYLQDELWIDPMWTGVATPGFTGPDEALVSYHAPDTATHRRDLVRFTRSSDLRENELGGKLVPTGLTHYGWCANTIRTPCLSGDHYFFDIHHPGLAQARLGWELWDGSLSMRLPAGTRDVSGFDAFQFRAVVPPGFDEPNWENELQDLSVVMIDGAGARSKVAASSVGNHNLAPPGYLPMGHVILNQTRFPLSSFSGVDLTDLRTVKFRFDRREAGVIQVADIAFSRGGVVLPKVP